jgi:DNA-binding transcriptional LysR family regulator
MARPTWDWEGRIGRRVKLRDIHVLSAVVRVGSMAKAATQLAMSQSAVSEAIASLEEALRVRLLDRTSQGIAPTIFADVLLRRGKVVFDELQQGIKDIEFLLDSTVGEVRVAAAEFLSVWLLPAAIDEMLREHPRIYIRTQLTNSARLEFQELHDRKVDLVIDRVTKNFTHEDLDIEVLLEDRHCVVAGTHSPWVRRRKIALADLKDEPWVIPANPVAGAVLQEAFEAEGLQVPTEQVSAGSVLLRINLVATGRFLTLMTDSIFRGVGRQLPFKVLPIELRAKPPPIVIIRLKNRTLSPVVELFIEHLRAAAKFV